MLSEPIAAGDGANDLAMLEQAGLGIAFCLKEFIREHIKHQINVPDLHQVIHLVDEFKK
ncbi:HAD hydrolase family protein [Streptococcus phocae]|uniref:HAD hydrolase family protein n=1 Tax=Streptococcus phocae TaxID=119224 RepID=UPI000AB5005D|nr:HAD hydrolase family protein [Streptococcus phocae]